jgi:3-deoxy-D-manno-octulosonic-acid transferase
LNGFDLAYLAASPLLLGKKREGWRERLGHVEGIPAKSRPRVMLHAVSVGEVNALRHLVPLLVKEPIELVVTASTDTGLARARELFAKQVIVLRYPVDLSRSVRRFLDAVRPDVVGLVELEVWPNFVSECERRGVPVGVINGRLSARSFRGYRRVRSVVGPTFRRLAFVAAQDEDYAARFVEMGVPRDRIEVAGTMKWDAAALGEPGVLLPGAAELAESLGIDRSAQLVVGGSTGPGEEALLHAVCVEVEKKIGRSVQLLCAPRKPERFDEAAAAMVGCVRRSGRKSETTLADARGSIAGSDAGGVKATHPPAPSLGEGESGRTDQTGLSRFLLDTIGELRLAYSLADVVVIGRSFGDLHGSDPIEAAALGKPAIIGPRYGDFEQTVRTLRDAGGLIVAERARLADAIAELLSDEARRAAMAVAARGAVVANKGASARFAGKLMNSLTRGAWKAPPP